MLLYTMLYIVLAYLMLFAALTNSVCLNNASFFFLFKYFLCQGYELSGEIALKNNHYYYYIIVAYINDYNLYSDCQHGFRKHRSCVTQLLHVVEDLSDMFDNGDPFDIIYLDFKKAFDQVSHKRLAVKL